MCGENENPIRVYRFENDGWTKDVPTTNGWYWLKDDKTGPVLTEALNGCFYIHNSRYAPEPNDEWLGPISPSDAEQLIELRKVMSGGIGVIARERARQVQEKGYTNEHDDEHDVGELGLAAALYALPYGYEMGNEPLITQDDFINLHITLETGCDFILPPEPDKFRRLAKAGALIAAEIDRLQRLNPQPEKETQ